MVEVRKPVLIKASLHRQLRILAFNHDVKLQDLMDVLLEVVFNNEALLSSALRKIKG